MAENNSKQQTAKKRLHVVARCLSPPCRTSSHQQQMLLLRQHTVSAAAFGTAPPTVMVEPKISLFDEKLKIALSGFPASERVTIVGHHVQGSNKILFASCGHYVTDSNGSVDVSQQPSLGGTYTGVEPLGILWSFKPAYDKDCNQQMSLNFIQRPCEVHIRVYMGHLDISDIFVDQGMEGKMVAVTEIERWSKTADVERIEIEEGNVRAVLFLPPGDGPFKGIIDMFGSRGGVTEFRAAMLASRGFAALSLPYFNYKDLPATNPVDLNYDYFDEALNWFADHPKVCKGGVGVMGISMGAEFACCMGAHSQKVSAVVTINGCPFRVLGDLLYKGSLLHKGAPFDVTEAVFTDEGMNLQAAVPYNNDFFPIWQGRAKYLVVECEDDMQIRPKIFDELLQVCPEEKKKDIQIVRYPGAGHLLNPPYAPLSRSFVHPLIGVACLWGGRPVEHCHAQEDYWERALHFFRQNIPGESSKA